MWKVVKIKKNLIKSEGVSKHLNGSVSTDNYYICASLWTEEKKYIPLKSTWHILYYDKLQVACFFFVFNWFTYITVN